VHCTLSGPGARIPYQSVIVALRCSRQASPTRPSPNSTPPLEVELHTARSKRISRWSLARPLAADDERELWLHASPIISSALLVEARSRIRAVGGSASRAPSTPAAWRIARWPPPPSPSRAVHAPRPLANDQVHYSRPQRAAARKRRTKDISCSTARHPHAHLRFTTTAMILRTAFTRRLS